MTDDDLARAIRDHYAKRPEDTVDDVGIALGETPGRVAFILDRYRVKDTGGVEHVGEGGGGGWLPQPEAEEG